MRKINALDSVKLLQQQCKNLNDVVHSKDSVIKLLKREKNDLSKKTEMSDTLILIVMSYRLAERYNPQKVDKAIFYYNKICSTTLKEDYQFRARLLKSYGDYYNEIKTFLLSIQNDPSRGSKFQKEKYKPKCQEGFKKLAYYKNYKSDVYEQKIPFLHKLMREIEKEINKHGEEVNNRIYLSDFGEILQRLED